MKNSSGKSRYSFVPELKEKVWKAEFVNNYVGHLAEISKKSTEGVAWFLLADYSKV